MRKTIFVLKQLLYNKKLALKFLFTWEQKPEYLQLQYNFLSIFFFQKAQNIFFALPVFYALDNRKLT